MPQESTRDVTIGGNEKESLSTCNQKLNLTDGGNSIRHAVLYLFTGYIFSST